MIQHHVGADRCVRPRVGKEINIVMADTWVDTGIDPYRKWMVILCLFLFTSLHAGLTDFKTIDAAKRAYEAKEYTKSAALLGGLESKTPQKAYDMGNAYYKAGKYDAAMKAYENAEGVDEQQRLHNIGNSYFQKKEWDKAIQTYEKALKIKEDKETQFNLELAKKQKRKQEEKKKQDQKKKDKKDDKKKDDKKKQDKNKQNKDQNKKDDQKKKKDQDQKQKKKQDQQKKEKKDQEGKEKKNKKGDKDKSDAKKKEQKPKDKKGDKASGQPKEQKKMSKEERLKVQELKRLMKKMQKGKTPTMIYQMGENKKHKRDNDVKPW